MFARAKQQRTRARAARGDRKRSRAARASRAAAVSSQEIGPIPEPADLERRAECSRDLKLFNETYLADRFELAWSEDHLQIMDIMQRVARQRDCFALAMDRSGGKSTHCESLAGFSVLGAYHLFACLITAARPLSEEMLDSLKTIFDGGSYPELAADFPEVCYPLAKLENIANRCKGQLCGGQRTHPQWKAHQIVLPTVKPGWSGKAARLLDEAGYAKTSGACITTRGIEGGIRGIVRTLRHNGKRIRPTLAICDDPQTEESADSYTQTRFRLRVIKRAVRRLAGPGQTTSVLVPCTVIKKGDLADQILDHELNPHFNGRRFKMLYDFPARMDLWEGAYDELRREGLIVGVGFEYCTEFYRKNRKRMQKGARVAWPERYDRDKGELDALQHAMNLYLEDRDGFFSECNNDPRDETELNTDIVDAAYICRATNELPRGVVPEWSDLVVAAADVQGDLLYWGAVAFSKNYTADVLAYGAWPEQNKRYFTLASVTTGGGGLSSRYAGTGEQRARAGLVDLADYLDRDWPSEDGEIYNVRAIGCDSRYRKKAVFLAAGDRHILRPTQGIYIGAGTEPLANQRRQDGDKLGPTWRDRKDMQFRRRKLQLDINEIKAQIHAAFAAPDSVPGRLRVYGKTAGSRPRRVGETHHGMLGDHCAAETVTKTRGHGRDCYEFKLPPNKPDNHLWDVLVSCYGWASYFGCALPGDRPQKKRRRRPRQAQELFA